MGFPGAAQVNADSAEEREAWFKNLDPLVDTIVFSPNLHEVRGYNRLAGLAKGDVIVLLQDDDLLPEHCDWLPAAVAAFRYLPDLALLGYQVGYLSQYNVAQMSHFSTRRFVLYGYTNVTPLHSVVCPLRLHKCHTPAPGSLSSTVTQMLHTPRSSSQTPSGRLVLFPSSHSLCPSLSPRITLPTP